MMKLTRNSSGGVNGVLDEATGANYPLTHPVCVEWIAKNNPDLSNAPAPDDADKNPLAQYVAKLDAGTATAADDRDAMRRLIRRLIRREFGG